MSKLWHLDSETARLIAAQRKSKLRSCVVCGGEFTTLGRGRYCKAACKRRAERVRKAQCESEREGESGKERISDL
jgi:hypothetical protein